MTRRFVTPPGVWTIVVRVTVTLLISIVIPLVTGLARDDKGAPLLSSFEQFMLGGLIFLSVTLTSASHEISEILRLRKQEQRLWEVRQSVDTMLSNARASFAKILGDAPPEENLFAQYFERVLSEVSASLHVASSKQELHVDELTFGTTDLLIEIMERRARDTLKLVHNLDARPNNFDFSTWARSFYKELTRLAAARKITIQRLFIYGDEADLKSPLAEHLFAFHSTNPGYDFRVIPRADWVAIVRGNKLQEAHSEFGVWGDILVYTAIRSSPTHMEGAYFSLPQTIARFREVFDVGWRLAATPAQPPRVGPVTVDELFRADLRLGYRKPGGGQASPQPQITEGNTREAGADER